MTAVAEHFPIVPASKMRPEWYSKLRSWVGEPTRVIPDQEVHAVYDLHTGRLHCTPIPVEQKFYVSPNPHTGVQGFAREYPGGWTIQAPKKDTNTNNARDCTRC